MKSKYILFLLITLTIFPSIAMTEEHTIQVISDYDNMRMHFSPKVLVIKKGDTVTWVNEVAEEHNMITYPDGYPAGASGFSSPFITEKDQKWSHTFTENGTYNYHCIPHLFMGMRGTIIVDKQTKPNKMNIPSKKEMGVYRETLLEFFDEDDISNMPDYIRAKKRMEFNK